MTQASHHRINGAALRAIREAQHIERPDLARIVGIDPSYLYKIETGERRPRAWLIRPLAEALGVPESAITHSAERVA
jgi:transcriptional regulator with XRE-family HTH domain